jgi:hypothetical protein
MRRAGYIHAFLWGIIFAIPCLGDGQEPVTILNYEQILESTINGISIPDGGAYTFWGWVAGSLATRSNRDGVSPGTYTESQKSSGCLFVETIGLLSIPEKKTASLQLFS